MMYYQYSDRIKLERFILENEGSTIERKNENLFSLYKILEYCEEPFMCLRKLQLKYLGESFSS